MRQNLNPAERWLSVVGGLAFAGLGRSESLRHSLLGKCMTFLGVKTAAVGIIGYEPLLELTGQKEDDDYEDFF
ncbi:hypothetical protein [Desulforamulus hydrothermalis]|uniref:Uncharacterized protein n=1 Tax=Desulforamulus hydrothermalis Lam5 = DSM 18033 TaxID=1121428 RepID=K8DWX8_9FIRM|nr:hypothetical protein [Desulforamulus hydrothermalis]CCO06974.1 conserved hypothetical protein [Desulforamulus hydrothermalis Lam5 = DSM 18033]SHG98487.1 hypothetical protein SAMN02745177_01015 [Desulforamulus hydrothermalis Lam5 = DSM 18033]